METVYSSACPRNCYSTCSFLVRVKDQKIVAIEPHPQNLATPLGPCIKGLSYVERAHSPERILHPLEKVNGEFQQISWERAFGLIVSKLSHYKKNFGSHSVLFYAASGMSGMMNGVSSAFWRKFGGTTSVYGNLCWPAGLEATRLTLGENKHNVPWDLENAKLIVLWGKNPAETNIHQMIPIEKAQQKGATLLVIDPRRTPSAERADLLIQPIPGTDGMLALAVAKILIEKNWIDHEFIAKNVLGFQEFSNSLIRLSVEQAAEECGVPVAFIEKLAFLMGTIKPMTLIPGYGMQRYTNGGQTTRCLLALSVITGNIGKPGACWHYANLQSYVFDEVKEPENYFPTETDKPFRRVIPTAKLGETMLSLTNPSLKMAWVERGNPLAQNPDSNTTKKAFENLEFVVVTDQFLTDTAQMAHLVLPAKNMFEQTDIIGSYWNPYVQLKPKILEPAGEVKPETEIYYLLAKNLGYSDEIIEKAGIPKPTDNDIEHFLEKILTSVSNISLNELKNSPQLSPFFEEIAFSDLKFNTPSGKIEIFSQQAEHFWNVSPLPTYENLQELPENSKYSLYLLTPNTKNRIHSQFNNLESIKILSNEATIYINSQDALQRNIKNNDKVLVFNDRGEIKLTAKINFSLKKGCVAITNGWQGSENPNFLSCGRETDMGFGTAFHDNLGEVKKN